MWYESEDAQGTPVKVVSNDGATEKVPGPVVVGGTFKVMSVSSTFGPQLTLDGDTDLSGVTYASGTW